MTLLNITSVLKLRSQNVKHGDVPDSYLHAAQKEDHQKVNGSPISLPDMYTPLRTSKKVFFPD